MWPRPTATVSCALIIIPVASEGSTKKSIGTTNRAARTSLQIKVIAQYCTILGAIPKKNAPPLEHFLSLPPSLATTLVISTCQWDRRRLDVIQITNRPGRFPPFGPHDPHKICRPSYIGALPRKPGFRFGAEARCTAIRLLRSM